LQIENEKGNVYSVSRDGSCYNSDYSRGNSYDGGDCGCSGGKNYIVNHKPKYVFKKNYIPRKNQNKLHQFKKYNKNHLRNDDYVNKYNKDYDSKLNTVNVRDLEKLLKLNKNHKSNQDCAQRSTSKLRKSNQVSKYLKDKNCKNLKKNNERSTSCSNKNSYKNSYKNSQNHKKDHENERQNSVEAQKKHNLVNLKDKSNEALLMKEKDKDNLHSNDRCVEEFDKLEHFKKVEERCRSASKARHADVKKHQDMDKCQAKNTAESAKEKRGRNKLRSNLNNNRDRFCNLEKCNENKESDYKKDNHECAADNLRERSFSCKSEKSTFSANDNKLCKNNNSNYDLVNAKNKSCKDAKDVCVNDDKSGYCKDNSYKNNREDACLEKDTFFNDRCDIC